MEQHFGGIVESEIEKYIVQKVKKKKEEEKRQNVEHKGALLVFSLWEIVFPRCVCGVCGSCASAGLMG
eukprot:scaffold26459_cov162-Cylindrotheca_fusiformis.AAC.1